MLLFHFGEANWREISELLNSDASKYWKFVEFLKGEQSNTELRKQALHRGESLSKKSSKAVSREKRLQKIVSEFQMKQITDIHVWTTLRGWHTM